MRIYNSTYTNSYHRNKSFPSIAKKEAIVPPSDNQENEENSNELVVNHRPSTAPSLQKGLSFRPLGEPVSYNQENEENPNELVVNHRPSTAPSLQKGLSYRTLGEPVPEGGACNLVYEPDSSGRLVEHYSTHEIQDMAIVGRWTAGLGKKIAGFKFKRNAGRNVLIGNCSAGLLGRKNYCNGFCQFVKSAKLMNGSVTLYDVPTGFKSMPVDVYLYHNDNRPGYQTIKLLPGESYTTENVLAVGCVPKNTGFYETETVDLMKWLHDAQSHGYSSKC